MQARTYAKLVTLFANKVEELSERLAEPDSTRKFLAAICAVNPPNTLLIDPDRGEMCAVNRDPNVFNTRIKELNGTLQASLHSLHLAQDVFFAKSLALNARLEGSQELSALARAMSEVCGNLSNINTYLNAPGQGMIFQLCGINPVDVDMSRKIATETQEMISQATTPDYSEAINYAACTGIGASLFLATQNLLKDFNIDSPALAVSSVVWVLGMVPGILNAASKAKLGQKATVQKASKGAVMLAEVDNVHETDPTVIDSITRSYTQALKIHTHPEPAVS